MTLNLDQLDFEPLVRRTFELAKAARSKGNHPFGALLCNQDGEIVLEVENTVGDRNDATCHAEQNLMSTASREFSREELGKLIMVTSTEPCAMCSGATFWTGVRAVVYGLSERSLVEMCTNETSPYPEVLNLPCREVFASAEGHQTVVIGPLLEDEAREPHKDFWTAGY